MERYLAAVLVLGVAAQWLAWRLRLPSILLLLLFGVALGEYVNFAHGQRDLIPESLLFPLVSLAVGVILFEGGMSLQFRELRESGAAVLGLVTIGAAITWLLSTVALVLLMDMAVSVAAVTGGILVVTGPTVVGPLLRLIRPRRRVASTVKWEGIVIDPIGALIAVLAFRALTLSHGETSMTLAAIGDIVRTVTVAVLLGGAGAGILTVMLRRFLIPDFLHNPAFLAAVLLAFTASNWLQPESGLLSVTLMGVLMANQRKVPVKHVIEFKENLQVLLIACLFIVLGAKVDPREVLALGWPAAGMLAVLILVIRPLSVWASTWRTALTWQERAFLAMLAPRGIVAAAVASVFALELSHLQTLPAELQADVDRMVPLTFLCIAATVAFYGLLAPLAARRLGLSEANPQGVLLAGAEPWIRDLGRVLQRLDKQVLLIDTNLSNVSEARMSGLDAHCANILAEYVHEEIDMAGIGRLLALTANNEVNTLAVREFAYLFGRGNVYQLPRGKPQRGRRQQIGEHLGGRVLFSEELDHDEIVRRLDRGGQIKSTQLNDEFPLEAFRRQHGRRAELLMAITETGSLQIRTSDSTWDPQPGHTVIYLLDGLEDDRRAAAGSAKAPQTGEKNMTQPSESGESG